MARTLIKNGTVVSPTGRHEVDVLIEGETILALLERGKSDSLNITADKVIDATGKFVVPGGIDVHTHMELPFVGSDIERVRFAALEQCQKLFRLQSAHQLHADRLG